MPSLNKLVQRLKVATLPLDLPCSGPVTHSGEISTTDKSHGKKPDRFSLNDDKDAKKVLRFKYATWNIFKKFYVHKLWVQLTLESYYAANSGKYLLEFDPSRWEQ